VSSLVVGLVSYLPSVLLTFLIAKFKYGMVTPEHWLSLSLFVIIAIVLSMSVLPALPRARHKFDFLGALLSAGCFGLLVFALGSAARDQSILMTVAEILHDEGYAVRKADNGMEGLAALEQQQPALILLDMRMPVLDGWGFVRALRERGLEVPLVVMTAAQDAGRWAREVGATGFIAKPFDLLELLAVVERLVPR